MNTRPFPKLISVGDNCLDAYLNKNLLTVGGNALNVAAQWRRAGWDARYFGAVGKDLEGEAILAELTVAGLEAGDVEVVEGDTAITLLRDRFGDRTFLLESLGVGENYMPTSAQYQAIVAADWVHLGTNSNPALVRRLVADAVPFSIDVSTRHFAIALEGVPLVFASGSDKMDADIAPPIAALMAAGAQKVVLTCGSSGSYFQDGSGQRHCKAVPIEVIDTCGAGDSFIATFILAYCIEGLAVEEAMRRASGEAAWTCTHLGGFPQRHRPIPDWLPAKYAEIIAQKEF